MKTQLQNYPIGSQLLTNTIARGASPAPDIETAPKVKPPPTRQPKPDRETTPRPATPPPEPLPEEQPGRRSLPCHPCSPGYQAGDCLGKEKTIFPANWFHKT